MPFGFGQRAVIDDAFAQHSLSRPVLVEVADLTTVPEYVAHGLGVALLPPELVLSSKHDLSIVPIAGADISWTLSVIVKAAHPASSTVDAFLDLIRAIRAVSSILNFYARLIDMQQAPIMTNGKSEVRETVEESLYPPKNIRPAPRSC